MAHLYYFLGEVLNSIYRVAWIINMILTHWIFQNFIKELTYLFIDGATFLATNHNHIIMDGIAMVLYDESRPSYEYRQHEVKINKTNR